MISIGERRHHILFDLLVTFVLAFMDFRQAALQGATAELHEKVATLTAESTSTYSGPPPPTVTGRAHFIPAMPVLNMQLPPPLPPLGSQDGRSSAGTMASYSSKKSLKSMKSQGGHHQYPLV